MPEPMMCCTLIVEDDQRFRDRFQSILTQTGRYRVMAAVDSVAAARDVVQRAIPDLLIVDLGLPDGSGLTVIREVIERYPCCASMVVTVFGDEEHVVGAIEAGACGYLLKDSGPDEFLSAVDDLLHGGSPLSPMVARLILNRMRGPSVVTRSNAPMAELSRREVEILTLVAKGFTFEDIRRLLRVSTNTVKTHVFRIYRKLAVHSRSQAVYEATRLGLIEA